MKDRIIVLSARPMSRKEFEKPMNAAVELLRRFALALAVWREARGESLRGKCLMAQTVENRVDDPRWPDTYLGVITQRSQFSSFSVGDPNATAFPAESDTVWPDCVLAADRVLNSAEKFTLANHYHALEVHPAWADPSKIVARE